MIKKLLRFVLLFSFFIVPLIVWFSHFKPFVAMKDFVFIASMLIAFVLLVGLVMFEKISFPKGRIYIAVLVYYAYILISHLIRPYTDGHYVLLITGLVIMFFSMHYAFDSKNSMWLFKILVSVSAVTSVYALLQFLSIDFAGLVDYFGSRVDFGSRVFSTFGNPNLQGGYGVFIIPILSALLIQALLAKKSTSDNEGFNWHVVRIWVYAVLLVLAVLSLIMSQTRGSWLAAIATGVVFIGYYIWQLQSVKKVIFSHWKKIAAFGVVVVLLGTGFFFMGNVHTEILNPETANLRMFYYTNSLRMIADDPILGKGVGSFDTYYPYYREKSEAYALGETLMEYLVEHLHNEH